VKREFISEEFVWCKFFCLMGKITEKKEIIGYSTYQYVCMFCNTYSVSVKQFAVLLYDLVFNICMFFIYQLFNW